MNISEKQSESLPISVIVTLQKSRRDFFCARCLPAIVASNPAEIIVELGPGGMSEKRNRGWRKATRPFLFFCDDDIVLSPGSLLRLYNVLSRGGPRAGWAYGHYRVRKHGGDHPLPDGGVVQAQPFNASELRRRNFVSSMSLIRAEGFPGWDEELKSYIDWDCWLSMIEQGWQGIFVDGVLFDAWYLDEGVSSKDYGPASWEYIDRKHPWRSTVT